MDLCKAGVSKANLLFEFAQKMKYSVRAKW